ncbi:electron transfer flavoprotein subunit beta/FixA family protein [Moritella sp.]|uniref:electron transfer flavoprotein subunit beta/FixA family protein n=1 Tax=Moritella sp. TaxID=78556 RepID=UPI001DE722DA|nr:electron transfer flavoprotein subunit beta/FixA family protein [Moritella sp.]MCJ8351493.1 electron transfer flavoprotein subunit beta/FixA family protein [Moritella sp.]NQZ40255.1 electron transfer flavoprotein subunit beta/FixA family protein [Moritella sp.]
MKILVAVKRVVDHKVNVRVKTDETGIETANVKMVINPFCEIAIEQAVRFKEQGLADEVVLVCIGPKAAEVQLRAGLALGADRAILIRTDEEVQSLDVAKLLHKVVQQQLPDLVLLGKQAIDTDNNQTGQMLAALTGMPQGSFASDIVFTVPNKVQVTREVDGGLVTLVLNLPAVITVDLRLNTPRYTSLPNIMKAKRKVITMTAPVKLGVNLSPRLTTLKVESPPVRQAGVKVADVADLVEKLQLQAKVT